MRCRVFVNDATMEELLRKLTAAHANHRLTEEMLDQALWTYFRPSDKQSDDEAVCIGATWISAFPQAFEANGLNALNFFQTRLDQAALIRALLTKSELLQLQTGEEWNELISTAHLMHGAKHRLSCEFISAAVAAGVRRSTLSDMLERAVQASPSDDELPDPSQLTHAKAFILFGGGLMAGIGSVESDTPWGVLDYPERFLAVLRTCIQKSPTSIFRHRIPELLEWCTGRRLALQLALEGAERLKTLRSSQPLELRHLPVNSRVTLCRRLIEANDGNAALKILNDRLYVQLLLETTIDLEEKRGLKFLLDEEPRVLQMIPPPLLVRTALQMEEATPIWLKTRLERHLREKGFVLGRATRLFLPDQLATQADPWGLHDGEKTYLLNARHRLTPSPTNGERFLIYLTNVIKADWEDENNASVFLARFIPVERPT